MGEISYFRKNGYFQYPRILQIEITTRCSLHCPQCYKDLREERDIDYEWLCGLLKGQKDYGLKAVMLNGGEPLLYPHILPLLQMLEEWQIRSNCFTSGLGIHKATAARLRGLSNLFLNISLNGSMEEINALSRDGYAVALKAISCLNAEGIAFGINWVARSDNVYDFPNVIELAEKYHANNILVVGNKINSNGFLESPLSLEELCHLNAIITEYEKGNGKIPVIIQQCYTDLSLLHGLSPYPINNGCSAGRIFCAINCKGQFMPCTHLPYYETYESINDYWTKSEILKQLREVTPKSLAGCSDCQKKDNCIFCRATERGTVRDLRSGRSHCILNVKK